MATSSSLATHLFPLKWELDVCVAPQAYSTVGSNTQKDLQIHRFRPYVCSQVTFFPVKYERHIAEVSS